MTDAPRAASERRGRWIPLLSALWATPLLAGAFGRLARPKTPWLVDGGAAVCGGERAAAGLPLYGLDLRCPDLASSAYVYPPWVAQALAAPVRLAGGGGVLLAYLPLLVAALGFLLWAGFGMRLGWARRRERAPFLAFVSWNPLVVGNVAVVQQAATLGVGLLRGADSVAYAATVGALALIKPTHLVYLSAVALAPASRLRRGLLIAAAALPVVLLCAGDLDGAATWRRFVTSTLVDPSPGGGFLRWAADAGVTDAHAAQALYLVYAALLFGAGLLVAERGGLDRRARLFLGLSLGVLLLPRVMAYDLLPLGPGWLAAAAAAGRASPRWERAVRWTGLGACALYLVASLAGGPLKILHDVALAALAAAMMAAGLALLRRPAAPASP